MKRCFRKCTQSLTHGAWSVTCLFFYIVNRQRWHAEQQFRGRSAAGPSISLSLSLFRHGMKIKSWHGLDENPAGIWLYSASCTTFPTSYSCTCLRNRHFVHGAYSVGRRSAALPRRRMMGPRGFRIFLTSALLSSEKRLTRLKPVNKWYRHKQQSGVYMCVCFYSRVLFGFFYQWCFAWLSEETAIHPLVEVDTAHL